MAAATDGAATTATALCLYRSVLEEELRGGIIDLTYLLTNHLIAHRFHILRHESTLYSRFHFDTLCSRVDNEEGRRGIRCPCRDLDSFLDRKWIVAV